MIVPAVPTPAQVREGARKLDLWSDEALARAIDANAMAVLVYKAMTSAGSDT